MTGLIIDSFVNEGRPTVSMTVLELIAKDLLQQKLKLLEEMGACERHGAYDRTAILMQDLLMVNEQIEFRKALLNMTDEDCNREVVIK